MNSVFPQWFVDIATFTTVIGFFLTLWLLYEARHIRNSFLRRARLPQVTKELKAVSKTLSSHLKSWGTQKEDARNQLSISRALLENLIPKLPNEEQKKCKAFVKQLKPRKWLIIKDSLSSVDEDQAWELYTELSAITTMLIQLEKDSKWD
ncbi:MULTISPECIES: hypothetical protein [Vibrio]|uniref:hypothetical protein n=1 Tax=Vibrio TaxID=662 RepID=UPI000471CEAC|nr:MULTISPECIES: hypothetical protein [Vibrio]HDM8146018.1 hypothetical protein [Vibrio harveyi]EHK9186442.1 hypothetical protein [Vibrio vulnificus]EHZ2756398.1 hypothetical protein [Vibrio vulnificus]EHZ2765496.1 hypothetical protein [Vibrio vulnificus]EKD8805236.1 hypothetical protein [Vibrio vulnificus]